MRSEVLARTAAVAGRLARPGAADQPVVVVGVLHSAASFVADLIRFLDAPVAVDFLAVSAYPLRRVRARLELDLTDDIGGRDVVVAFGVIDTGLTASFVVDELRRRNPASLRVCCLVDRRGRRLVPVAIDAAGFVVADELVVGSGLEHAGRFRNAPGLHVGDPAWDDARAAAYEASLFAGHGRAGDGPR
jgi:hypoxanthine phosphoribosyltransferase